MCTLNNVYAQAVPEWAVESKPSISVAFPNGNMTHGGSNAVSVFNADQKAVINTFGAMEKDALYLFFVENVKGKDGDIGGYMPLQRQAGFIYELPNNELIAHELGHGAFNLRHTFSTDDFVAAQGSTDNLMDYKGGSELWMHQWKKVQDPEKVFLSFLEGEEEGEMRVKEGITDKELRNLCYSYNLKEQIYSRSKYDHPYVVSSQENILQYFAGNRGETYLFPSQEIVEKIQNSSNPLNYDAFSDDVYIGNGIYDRMITVLKSGESETCPAVFDGQDKEDFVIELLRALRLARKNSKSFSYDFGSNLNISLGSLTLPNVKDSAGIKNGGKLTDVEIITNAGTLSGINPNEYELQEEHNYLSKNDKYLCFEENKDGYALKIKTNEDCFGVLWEYIYGGKIVTKPNNELQYDIQDVKTAIESATKYATDYNCASCCNICVRSAIWEIAHSSVLFPIHGNFIGAHNASDYLYGKVSVAVNGDNNTIGTANSVCMTLEQGLIAEFKFIENMEDTTIPDFKQLQQWANEGQIIIGILTNHSGGSGHIVMIAPYSDNLDDKTIYDYRIISRNNVLMPKILECGKDRKEQSFTLQKGVQAKDISLMKWYKMINIYTSENNKIFNQKQ
jgi:hypothetical protein